MWRHGKKLEYKLLYNKQAIRELKKIDKPIAKKIKQYLERLVNDPYAFGKPLVGNYQGLWRYRVNDYRILCEIHNSVVEIHVIAVGHRKDIYED